MKPAAAEQKEKAEQAADILTVLAELNRSNFMIECGRQLAKLSQAITLTGKKGKLIITLDIVPSGLKSGRVNQFEISPEVTIKEPQPNQGTSIFFVSPDNKLSRDDPDQTEIDFEGRLQ